MSDEPLNALGQLHFWRLAIRPGRPLALGHVGDTAFAGIPGNPVAVMVTFMVFVRPIIRRLAGRWRRSDHSATRCRQRFLAARRLAAASGFEHGSTAPRAIFQRRQRFERDGAGILTSMVESDGLIELSEEVAQVTPGDIVPFLPYSEVLT